MTRVLVLYHSTYGHIEAMASAVAEGIEAAGAAAFIRRVPETVPEDVARQAGYKLDQPAPVARVEELPDYDAIIFGSGTRYGNVTSQLRAFIDQTGGLWARGALNGKVGSVFVSSATQHGGQESTVLSFIPTLMHLGLIVVGLPYAFQGQMGVNEVMGNSPYGASTITHSDGSRQPSEVELAGARFQGHYVARVATALKSAPSLFA
ncbi:MAG: NAD(P)H:quinone oxidoreductase [Alphaproteobacteria bacterium]|nr:MAG: NAD(P)H:quinone oxidoreductase [Alphaproteobacteria bacterium]